MSTGWLDRASRTTSVTPTHLIRTWSIVDPRRKTLDGVAITISGLDRSITDVLVRIVPIQGNARTQFMTSQTRSEEHTSELQSLMRISYAVFCLKTKNPTNTTIL